MSGLCGVLSGRGNGIIKTLFFGTDYHSHLGSSRAGLAMYDNGFEKKIRDISQAQFKSKFADSFQDMSGSMGIGVISDSDAQPLLIHSRFGTYALAASGLVANKDELVRQLFQRGSVFTETNSSGVNTVELLAKIIELGSSLQDGIEGIFDHIEGSVSLLLMTSEGMYAARDRLGRTPLHVAENEEAGEFMVASENSAFPNLGFEQKHTLVPGEILFVDGKGWRTVSVGPPTPNQPCMQICAFLWVYSGYPASSYEGLNTEVVRERCGAFLAQRDDVEADLVSGLPDSGVGHAIGYAMRSGLPYRRVLVKYTPGYGRSYTPTSQSIRDHVAHMKLIPIPEVIRNNRIVLCEDSIVRGTQLKQYTVQKLEDANAREIHVRVACPPLMFPCRFTNTTRSKRELVTHKAMEQLNDSGRSSLEEYLDEDGAPRRNMVEWIRRHLKLTSLRFQRLEDMVEAIGLPRDSICLYCWTGRSDPHPCRRVPRQLNLL